MIYIITHKKFKNYFNDEINYRILHVGNNKDYDMRYLLDSVGENISSKNAYFCELTGLYWMWKNAEEKKEDIIGLVHYRRYFTYRLDEWLYTYFNIKPRIFKYDKIKKKINEYDIILPVKEKIFRTVEQSYADVHNKEDLNLTKKVISLLYPEYVKTFNKVMNSHSYYYANMFICKKKLMDEYSKWLFDILFELENVIDISKYEDDYQKRVFGFLSERLLQVWVVHNNLRVYELPAFNTEERRINIFKKNISRLKNLLMRI